MKNINKYPMLCIHLSFDARLLYQVSPLDGSIHLSKAALQGAVTKHSVALDHFLCQFNYAGASDGKRPPRVIDSLIIFQVRLIIFLWPVSL